MAPQADTSDELVWARLHAVSRDRKLDRIAICRNHAGPDGCGGCIAARWTATLRTTWCAAIAGGNQLPALAASRCSGRLADFFNGPTGRYHQSARAYSQIP